MAGFDLGQGFQGAMGGAMAGSAFGPIGTGIGAIAGGLIGGFSGNPQEQYRRQLEELSRRYGNRQAPQAGPAATAGYSGFRTNQAGLIAQLEAMARGEGPSAAAMQMREAMDRAAATQASGAAAAAGRGVNAGAAFRQAANNTAAIQAQGARDTATMRAAEQLNAIQQLGGVINQGRAADEGVSMFNAGQSNQMDLANLQAKLQMLGLNDEAQLRALLAAMGTAPQPLGTSILAGGAQAFPSILQYRLAQKNSGGAMGFGPNYSQMSLLPGGTYYSPQPRQYPANDFTGYSG
jgi:hypothetical protein